MFQNDDLKNHLETSSVVKTKSAIIAEWNMNIANNIQQIGNYRYRQSEPDTSTYKYINNTFDQSDAGNYYTNATDSDIIIDGGFKDDDTPDAFKSTKDKIKLLYSLEECFNKFRPRSGINKLMFFEKDNFIHHSNINLAKRPRYYMSDKNDKFKYWTSYRTEDGSIKGISYPSTTAPGTYLIDDTAPFIVYKDQVPSNRIVVKMQTHIGSIDLGPFNKSSGSFADPFYGDSNKKTPLDWKIQILQNNNWIDVVSFKATDTRRDGTPIIKDDGYVEIAYGLMVPDQYRDIFIKAEEYTSIGFLPEKSVNGYAYLIKENENDIGEYHIWVTDKYETFVPKYGWYLQEETVDRLTNFVTDLTDPKLYVEDSTSITKYKEFEYISGIRIVVNTMTKNNSTFDLIEISPRLSVDLSDRTTAFDLSKIASDIGNSGMPVGQLLASNGSVSLFDYDQAFNPNNTQSIISKFLSRNIQFKFYEVIVDVAGYDYFVPIKTMYSEGFPKTNFTERSVSIELRDLFFYFESITAPELLIPNVSLSYAVSLLLDSIGFTNYSFKQISGESELIISYFYVGPDRSIAQALNELAVSSQSSMFFDEYNNFIMMSKNYMMPSEDQRETDFIFYGDKDFEEQGAIKNNKTAGTSAIANIIELSSVDNNIYNNGKINYETKYIQKSVGSVRQASLLDKEKNWAYKPALLWEVAGEQRTKSANDESGAQSGYTLSAIPLNSDLSENVPSVSNNIVINNIIDLGEAVYWMSRYNGYLYANGEIIKYDAIEFNVPKVGFTETQIGTEFVELQSNNVWITSLEEYQNYFSKLSFNGKIYPTGRVRIYTEPNYEEINGVLRLKNGAVAKHGRGQFGTSVVSHSAGLNQYWSDNNNVRGCTMKSKLLFDAFPTITSTGVDSEEDTLNLSVNANIKVGQKVSILSGTGQLSTQVTKVVELLDPGQIRISPAPVVALDNATVLFETILPNTTVSATGINNALAQKTTRNGIIRNFLSPSLISESEIIESKKPNPGTVQSSALVMNGPSFTTTQSPLDFMSYVYKPLDNRFKHFGTRMRIIGRIQGTENKNQSPIGTTTYYSAQGSSPKDNITIGGGSGGLAVMVNPSTNIGYYFEIVALTESDLDKYGGTSSNLANVIFYKIKASSETDDNLGVSIGDAIPVKLWSGITTVIVDDGKFTGQARMNGEEVSTVYDVAVEYEDIGKTRKFYLYINNQVVGVAFDQDPLPAYNNMGLFVRGSSRVMFENIYAVSNNYSQNTSFKLDVTAASIFDDSEININEAFRKYAMPGIIQSTVLSGISQSEPPKHNFYFEEFGTIMREAAYFNVKYDKAYPALYAKISPTFNRLKGYTISGFRAGAYGAEFLIFNATDTVLSLDEQTGNYLRIQGVTFTQQSQNELTVDNYFTKNSDFSNPTFEGTSLISSPFKYKKDYDDIKTSRMTYGNKEFVLDTPYIQTQDSANSLMGWMVSKIMKPRRSLGLRIFATPTIQLGDIVKVNYKEGLIDNIDNETEKRFVVYNIKYTKDIGGPSMSIFLSEVL